MKEWLVWKPDLSIHSSLLPSHTHFITLVLCSPTVEINQDSTRAHELKTESKARELVYHSLFLKNMKNESVLVGFVCQSDTSWSHHKEPPLRKSLYETQL